MNRLVVMLFVACSPFGFAHGDDKKPQEIKDWGTVTDPEKDSKIKEEKGKLTVTVPGAKRDLSPATGNLNAPRVLREVEGNFTATVKVTGEFEPGEKGVMGTPFNGAGLLVWKDEKNILRLERNKYWVAGQMKYFCYPPLCEYFKDGQYQNTNPTPTADDFFKEKSIYLRVERTKDKLVTLYSFDRKEWKTVKEIEVDLPAKVQVGVAAVNTSEKEFTVEFEEFTVVVRK